jgi:hypothetical protein
VVEDVRVELVEAHGLLIRDKMHLVTFVGEGFAQFCGEDAAAAESRITDNSDAHGFFFIPSAGAELVVC